MSNRPTSGYLRESIDVLTQGVKSDHVPHVWALIYEIRAQKRALECIANSDGWLVTPAPLCTVEEAYDRCVDIASKTLNGGSTDD